MTINLYVLGPGAKLPPVIKGRARLLAPLTASRQWRLCRLGSVDFYN